MARDENGYIPPGSLTTAGGLLNWVLRKPSEYNIFGSKNAFQAKVLTTPSDEGAYGKRACLVRILDPAMAHMKFLTDPCNISVASDPILVSYLQSLHIKMIIPALQGGADLKKNDIVDILLEPSGHGNCPYDLQTGKFLQLTLKANNDNTPPQTPGCLSLTATFDGAANIASLGAINGISPNDWRMYIEHIKPLLNFIASGEGSYNAMNQGTHAGEIVGSDPNSSAQYLGKELTVMTISEIQTFQAKPKGAKDRLFAAGRYQIIPASMPIAIANSGLTGDFIFNEENQDILGAALIFAKRPDMGNYILGLHDNRDAAHLAFAQEWASVPDPRTGNDPRSYYGSGNQSSHTNEQVAAALDAARAAVSSAQQQQTRAWYETTAEAMGWG